MSKEIYISTTPHETRLAIVEDEQLAEIYYERENEYTLAGSIYNGKVTRVLPGMQSSFVDIGLERDAFLYVTDFMEEAGDSADFETDGGSRRAQAPRAETAESTPREQPAAREQGGSREQGGRDRGRSRRDRSERRDARLASDATPETESATSFDEPIAPAPTEAIASIDAGAEGGAGSRRWRGRRGRRRGRGAREERPAVEAGAQPANEPETEEFVSEEAAFDESNETMEPRYEAGSIEIDLSAEPAAPEGTDRASSQDGRGRRGGRNRDRRGRGDREPRREEPEAPAYDNSYAGYYDESAPAASGEPIVLPGESIRKYRDPAEVAAEDEEARRNAPPAPEVLTVSTPTIEIVGWDGGAVLPGETLSRRRTSQSQSRQVSSPAPVAVPPVAAAPVVEVAQPAPVAEGGAEAGIDATEAAITTDLGALPLEVSPAVEEAPAPAQAAEQETPAVETEYEPEEGASVSITDTTRRDLRRFEQPTEQVTPVESTPVAENVPVAEDATDLVTETPDQTTYDLSAAADEPSAVLEAAVESVEPHEANLTTLQSSGEMLSQPVDAEQGVTPLPAQDEPEPAAPIQHEEAVQSVSLTDAEPAPFQLGEVEEAADETSEESTQPESHTFGDGDFHEEEIDELDGDEFEFEASSPFDEAETEEYEEETLEGAADLGAVLHEMSVDRETSEEDDDEFEQADASGGFTEADFGGESEEDEDAPAEESTAGNASAEPRRERNDRHRRGGNRDRRGGRNSGGDRGRNGGGGRRSMQTTDLPAINELLKPGQEILVQIAKEPIAKKGARITSHIALPGRFLVFMPTVNHTGVSRKISSDEERRRLKSILLSEKGDAQGGFIVRTAADGASEEELRNDLRFLIHLWNDIKQRSESSKSPALIYHDLSLVERILRDQVTDNFSAIWVDTEAEYERVLRFLQRFQPSLVRRVKLYTKETPLFEHFGVTQEIDKALKAKVWLKSGGSIVINQTEALVAIDINTGKYVGKTARLEDTILKTNLDSIPEIVRQIRLRDLGGIIVIDFIDMDERKNRAKVLQALEDAMRTDRAPSKILPFNDFGLVIMTRKRVKQSLERTLCIPDPITEGTGMIKSPITVANEIFVEMRKMHRHLEKQDIMLRVHPEVVKTLKASGGKRLQELEEMTRKTILVKSDPALNPEQFDIH